MPKLRCSVRNCSHNKDDYCSLGYIEVDGTRATNVESTCCANFDGTEYTASNEVHECQLDVEIKCSAAACLYNRDARCTAHAVNMSGATTATCSHDTQCGSFWCI